MKQVLGLAVGNLTVAMLVSACATATAPPTQAQPAAEQTPGAATPVNSNASLVESAAPAAPVSEQSSGELPAALTAEHLIPVVAAVAPRVKAQCWQPGLDTRPADAPSNARVLVHAQIDASGSVAEAHTDDSPPGYPQLADCVLKLVRSLSFQRTQAPVTAVNISFVFDTKDPSAAAPASAGTPPR